MKLQMKRTALMLAVLTVISGTVLAAPHVSRSHDAVRAMDTYMTDGVQHEFVVKILDKTRAGIGKTVLNDLANIAKSERLASNEERTQALQKELDFRGGHRYAVISHRSHYDTRLVDVYMIYDTDVKNTYRAADPLVFDLHSTDAVESRWSVPEGKTKAEVILDHLKNKEMPAYVPSVSPALQNFPAENDYTVSSYQVADSTDTLTETDMEQIRKTVESNVGDKVTGLQLRQAKMATQAYLDGRYGVGMYWVDLRQPQGQDGVYQLCVDFSRTETVNAQHLHFGIVDTSCGLTSADRSRIRNVLENIAKQAETEQARMLAAKHAVQEYLDTQYGKEIYHVWLHERAGAFYQVVIEK